MTTKIQQSINTLMELATSSVHAVDICVNYSSHVQQVDVYIYKHGTASGKNSELIYHRFVYLAWKYYDPEQMLIEMIDEVRELVEREAQA